MLYEDKHPVIGRLHSFHIVLLGGPHDRTGSTPRSSLDGDMFVAEGNSMEADECYKSNDLGCPNPI